MPRRKRRGASVGDVAVIVAMAVGVLFVAFVGLIISALLHNPVLLMVLAGGGA